MGLELKPNLNGHGLSQALLHRLLRSLAGAGGLLLCSTAMAGPWVLPGDARLRADVELLKANGHVNGPMNAWPLPWSQIDDAIARARNEGVQPPAIEAALGRLEALSERNVRKSRYEVEANVTNEAALVRGFADTARNPGDVTVTASHDRGKLSVTWGGSWVSDGKEGQPATQSNNGFSFAPSHAALKLGDWALYGGWVETYWGPGYDGSMLFSTSARAFPKVGIRMMRPKEIDLPVLRWLGPVSFDMFVGILDEERDYDNPAAIGIRFAFQPTPYFEIGLNRALQLCGSGRPCDLKIITRALLGFNDFDNTGTLEEPGNQVAGFDMAYRRPIGKTGHALKLTFETVAEDADNVLIEQFSRQIGGAILGPVGRSGASYEAGIEYTDSQAAKFLGKLQGGEIWPGSSYNNFIYTDGYTYGRRPIGFSLDGDARVFTLHGAVTDTRNRRWYASARSLTLNLNAYPRYRISLSREKIGLLTAGVNWPSQIGDLRFEARLQDNAPNTPDHNPLRLQAEMGWTTRF